MRSSHSQLATTIIGGLFVAAACTLWAAVAAVPSPVAASCGATLTFEQEARQPGVSMFTGRAVREIDNGWGVLFEVDRWFTGAYPARLVEFDGTTTGLIEPPTAGSINATYAIATAGDAIALVRGKLVFMAAYGPGDEGPADGRYTPSICGIGAVPMASAEGRAYVRKAIATFGPGLRASDLPATDTVADATETVQPVPRWLPFVAFAVGLGIALPLFGRRSRRWSRS